MGLGLVGWFQGRVSKVSRVRVSANIAFGPGFTFRVGKYVRLILRLIPISNFANIYKYWATVSLLFW